MAQMGKMSEFYLSMTSARGGLSRGGTHFEMSLFCC